jgi:hypothetical protein
MLGNLKTPPEPFSDIIHTHFRLKAKSLSAQLDDWLNQDDGKPTSGDGGYSISNAEAGGSANGLKKDIEELKGMLKQLEVSAGGR